METILANVAGKIRRASLSGRDYLVAPVSMIIPGVLAGSKGPLYYPPDEIDKDPSSWNHIPLTLYHPTRNGQNVSARDPDVLERQGLGHVFRAKAKGRLTAEGWFDVLKTAEVDKRYGTDVLKRLENGQPIELSTGLFTDNEPAPVGSSHNGRAYTYIARNYRPDHLAILPDQVGACSIKDGCGVLVNKKVLWLEVENAFCPTGEGGGIDPSCSSGGGGSTSGGKLTAESGLKLAKDTYDKALNLSYEDINKSLEPLRSLSTADLKKVSEDLQIFGARGSKKSMLEEIQRKVRGRKEFHDRFSRNPTENWQPLANRFDLEDCIDECDDVECVDECLEELAYNAASWELVTNADGGGLPSEELDISPEKACQILKDGSVRGHELTEDQRGMFGAICGERDKKTENQWIPLANAFCPTGEGGGVDPSCSPGGGSGSDEINFKDLYDRAASAKGEEISKGLAKLEGMKKSQLVKIAGEIGLKGMENLPAVKVSSAIRERISGRHGIAQRMGEIRRMFPEGPHRKVSAGRTENQWVPIGNAFCPTGAGGGIDPSCSPGGGGGGKADKSGGEIRSEGPRTVSVDSWDKVPAAAAQAKAEAEKTGAHQYLVKVKGQKIFVPIDTHGLPTRQDAERISKRMDEDYPGTQSHIRMLERDTASGIPKGWSVFHIVKRPTSNRRAESEWRPFAETLKV